MKPTPKPITTARLVRLEDRIEKVIEGMERQRSLTALIESHLDTIVRHGLLAATRIERHLYAMAVATTHAANPVNLAELNESIAIVERLEASTGGQG